MTNTEDVPRMNWMYSRLATIVVVTGALSHLAVQFIDPLLIFGGTDCSTSMGIQSCVGYPPAGILILILASVFAVGAVECAWRKHNVQ